MRAMAHSAASSDQTRCAAAEAAFAEAKAFLCSAEAQQMSESDLERELHRRGQELIRKFLQGHLAQRSPGKAAGPVEGADAVERSPRYVEERHTETTCGTVRVARLGESRSATAPGGSSTSRAPPCTASTPRCGNRHHPRSRVCLEDAACVPSLHRRHRRCVPGRVGRDQRSRSHGPARPPRRCGAQDGSRLSCGSGCEAAATGGLSHASCSPPHRCTRPGALCGGGGFFRGDQSLPFFARGPADE